MKQLAAFLAAVIFILALIGMISPELAHVVGQMALGAVVVVIGCLIALLIFFSVSGRS